MKKQIILMIFAIFLLITINIVSAEVQFFENKLDMGNGTIKNHLAVFYNKGGITASDYVSGNNLFEVNLLYDIYVNKFNIDNPNFKIDKCDLLIYFWGNLQNSSSIIVNQTFDDSSMDTFKAKYFMKLASGDGMIVDEICQYNNKSFNDFNIPADMQLQTPSWECKACQFYEWTVQQKDIDVAKVNGDNVVTITDYIRKLFLINFEIWLAFFWFFLIICIFLAIGLLFVIGFWIYKYLNRIWK